ncbi:hypothetical protein [Bradyrhizobium sp. USDA 4350]
MTARFRSFDDLPLFASEDEVATALLGTGKITVWRQISPLLEAKGFPTIDAVMGGRYTPAIKAFFDNEYRISVVKPVASRESRECREALGSWSGHRKNVRRD